MSRLRLVPRPVGVDGVHYTVTGDGPHTLVLVHGYSDNLSTWHRVIPALAVTHRVIALDLPGFGASTREWSRPLLAGYADVVAEVLDAEGVHEPVTLMGNSMGAATATVFARRHARRTAGVVLIDMPGLHGVPRLWRFAVSRPAETSLRAALRLLPERTGQFGLAMMYRRVAAARPRDLAPDAREGYALPYARRGSVPAILPIARQLLRELATADLAGVLDRTPVPSLLVFGARDLLTPARVMRRLGKPGGAVVLPGCGHCPQLDQPGALLAEVVPFLADAQRAVVRSSRTA